MACPFTTRPSFITGLLEGCSIAAIIFFAPPRGSLVSASSVIIYFVSEINSLSHITVVNVVSRPAISLESSITAPRFRSHPINFPSLVLLLRLMKRQNPPPYLMLSAAMRSSAYLTLRSSDGINASDESGRSPSIPKHIFLSLFPR